MENITEGCELKGEEMAYSK